MHDDLTEIWQTLHDRLHHFVQKRVRNSADVEDIVQEIFLRVDRNLPSLKDRDRTAGWIFQIARNAIIDYYRSPWRQREILLSEAGELQLIDDRDESDSSLTRELAACLPPLLATLPDTYRIPLELVELQGISQRAIASRLGLSISGTKSRIQRG
jgi:RNA polymerase sigma-70 factor, ECF subfamily